MSSHYVFESLSEAEQALERVNSSELFKDSLKPYGYQAVSQGVTKHPQYRMTHHAASVTALTDGRFSFPSVRPLVHTINTYRGLSPDAIEARAAYFENYHALPAPEDVAALLPERDD